MTKLQDVFRDLCERAQIANVTANFCHPHQSVASFWKNCSLLHVVQKLTKYCATDSTAPSAHTESCQFSLNNADIKYKLCWNILKSADHLGSIYVNIIIKELK